MMMVMVLMSFSQWHRGGVCPPGSKTTTGASGRNCGPIIVLPLPLSVSALKEGREMVGWARSVIGELITRHIGCDVVTDLSVQVGAQEWSFLS